MRIAGRIGHMPSERHLFKCALFTLEKVMLLNSTDYKTRFGSSTFSSYRLASQLALAEINFHREKVFAL